MNRRLLQLLLCFLAGLVSATAVQWTLAEPAFPQPAAIAPPSPPPSSIVALSAEGMEFPAAAAAFPAAAEPARPGNPELARKLMAAALPVIRKSPPQERGARWALLLHQLKEEGAAGLEVLAAFLATGEDLQLGPPLDFPGVRLSGPSTLRMAALDHLSRSQEPAARELRIRESLRSLQFPQNADDTRRYMKTLQYLEPGKHRAEIVAAAQRLAADADQEAMSVLAEVIVPLGATELLPWAEAQALQQPEKHMPALFGMLWNLPDDARAETTERLLTGSPLAPRMQDALEQFDYRLPIAREFAASWFVNEPSATKKARVIERLGSIQNLGPKHGRPAQAEARLALLEELTSIASEPYLQQRITATRAALERQIQGQR